MKSESWICFNILKVHLHPLFQRDSISYCLIYSVRLSHSLKPVLKDITQWFNFKKCPKGQSGKIFRACLENAALHKQIVTESMNM